MKILVHPTQRLRRLRTSFLSLFVLSFVGQSRAEELLMSSQFVPLSDYEEIAGIEKSVLVADRVTYWNDDPVGQFVAHFENKDFGGREVNLELSGKGGQPVWSKKLGRMKTPKLAFLLKTASLAAGEYRLRCTLLGDEAAVLETRFNRENRSNLEIEIPAAGIPLQVEPAQDKTNSDWPVCTGVPFPSGTLSDEKELALFENGKPVPAQISVVSTWHPPAKGLRPSIRWTQLMFNARYDKGVPRKYSLRRGRNVKPRQPVIVREKGEAIIVSNGIIQFTINKRHFNGLDSAWCDINDDDVFAANEQVIRDVPKNGGAYLIDHRGVTFTAAEESEPKVVIEEAGPMRAIIAAEGWYTNARLKGEERLCSFKTRLTVYAGLPWVRVQHHTIVTFDANSYRLQDVGFHIPAPVVKSWQMGGDGRTLKGEISKGGPFMHQYRWNRFRVGGLVDENGKPVGTTGEKSDGWMTAILKPEGGGPNLNAEDELGLEDDQETLTPAVSVFLRDIWQKFPKEIEVSEEGLHIHFWPRHGMRTFNETELYDKSEIYKLRYFHHGSLLDLRFPTEAHSALVEMHRKRAWDPEGMIEAAVSGNAQGVAIGNDFMVMLHAAEDEGLTTQPQAVTARLFQQDPHARPDPEWSVNTGVAGKLTASRPGQFSEVEAGLNSLHIDYMKSVIERSAEYGMFIYSNTHNHWSPDEKRALLHRVWQAGHYQHVWTPWMLYFRGGPFELLRWARAHSDHYMNISTVNYADPDGRIRFHTKGAMYHTKGFVPWGSAASGSGLSPSRTKNMGHAGLQGHYINPDAFLFRYLIEGNRRALDAYKNWISSLKASRPYRGASRETNTTLGELLPLYRLTWDTDILVRIATIAESMVTIPMEEMPHPPSQLVWHQAWFSRLYDLTRDPRITKNVIQYTDDGNRFGRRHPNVTAWLYHQTGKREYLLHGARVALDSFRNIYRNPDDPMNGFRTQFGAYRQRLYRAAPYWLAAAVQAGLRPSEIVNPPSVYPSNATHPQFIRSEGPALLLFAHQPEDRPFKIRMESLSGRDHYQPAFRVISPKGKLVHQQKARSGSTRYLGENIQTLDIPKDGERGLYRIDFRNWGGIIFLAPLTDLPAEASRLSKDRPATLHGRFDGWLQPVGDNQKLTFQFKALKRYDKVCATSVRLYDANGKAILETSLLYGSERAELSADIDTATHPSPYRLVTICPYGPSILWTGSARGMVVARDGVQAKLIGKLVGER